MKIPTILMASLVTIGMSAQTTKPAIPTKKPVKKVKKITDPETPRKPKPVPKAVAKKDTLIRAPFNCPACGMG